MIYSAIVIWARLVAVPLAVGTVYFALTEGQWIHWISGPLTVALIIFGTTSTNERMWREIGSWRRKAGNPPRVGETVATKKKRGATSYRDAPRGQTPRRVPPPPAAIHGMLAELGGKIADVYELVPGTAYLAVGTADPLSASEYQTVVCLLDEKAPPMRVRPLPIVEGVRQRNTGLIFQKDRAFSQKFLVEAWDGKRARGWLSSPVRKALKGFPDAWLTTKGSVMAVTAYGLAQDTRMMRLINSADVLFAEHGADGGPPLLKAPPKKKKAAGKTVKKTAPKSRPKVDKDVVKTSAKKKKKGAGAKTASAG